MTIRFQCKCGKVLMAADDQGGLEGQCPACKEVMQIPPVVETAETEMSEDPLSQAPVEPGAVEDEPLLETEVLEEMGEAMEEMDEPGDEMGEFMSETDEPVEELGGPMEEYPEFEARKGGWFPTSRFAMVASIVVVVVVALVVFMLVGKERETPEEVVVIEKIQSVGEAEEEISSLPVGAVVGEETTPGVAELEEPLPIVSSITEPEPIEPAVTEPETGVESEVVSGAQEQQTVASTAGETPAVEEPPSTQELPPAGSFTINVASFREKENAVQYVGELKESGIDAYDWEVDLPQKGKWYRVSVGGFPTREAAEVYVNELKQKGMSDIFVTRVPGTS
jgi:cell division septation protein DedD/phage FluMu protein Com